MSETMSQPLPTTSAAPLARPQPGDGAYLASMTQTRQAGGGNGGNGGDNGPNGGRPYGSSSRGGRRRGGCVGGGEGSRAGRQPRESGHTGPQQLDANAAPFVAGGQQGGSADGSASGSQPMKSARGGRQGQRRPKADAAARAEAAHAQSGQNSSTTALRASAADFQPPSAQLARTHIDSSGGNAQRDDSSAPASRAASEGPKSRNGRGRGDRPRGRGGKAPQIASRSDTESSSIVHPPKQAQQNMSSRRAAFEQQTKLTTSVPAPNAEDESGGNNGVAKQVKEYRKKHKQKEVEKDDLVSRLTRGLSKRPFLECPICFNSINPAQPIWSCLPPSAAFEPTAANPEPPSNYAQACYTPFHLSCIRDWANRSLAEEADKLRDRAEDVNGAQWRCPGCQKKRSDRVGGYKCFCGRVGNPATNGPAPHSCGEGCTRKRLGCDHSCPLPCHPGPCPPCQVALIVPCPSHHTSLTVKCAVSTSNNAALSPVCDEPCGKVRSCGHPDHTCELSCHFGECAPCDAREIVKCYCGEEEREVECGWRKGDEKQCTRVPEPGIDEHWNGRFDCGRLCARKYDCGIHECQEVRSIVVSCESRLTVQTCHPHSIKALPCPSSPSVITHCPCGSTPLSILPGYPRPDCMAPVPTCAEPCPRSRPCGHKCPLTCHQGECPPCHEKVTRPCRCGESILTVPCEVMRDKVESGETELTCERVCKALRTCGRHECGRVCCPLAFKAKSKGGKRRDDALLGNMVAHEEEELHACPLTCGKMLSCGLHACPKKDHKGACGRCLQASYDELICHCGHTVIYPPVACGTTINCLYPCARPAPECGHPKTPHSCHESPDCPPCPYLTSKPCACGKDPSVKNVRCAQDRVSCGQVCGAPLECGFHKCDRSCHTPGECPPCSQVCGKPKRACKHPCTATCHAPAKCPENDPCQAIITQSCACGNLQTRTSCGATATNPTSRETAALKCNSECLVKQRNARLADALGIKVEGRGEHVWPDDLKAFAAANSAFVVMVEGKFKEFFASSRQTMILPHMPAAKRTFVFALADAYKLGRELIDQEPNTSVMIRRRVDTRVPTPLLSSTVSQPVAKPSFGGLANLRAGPSSAVSATGSGAWGRSSSPASGPTQSAVSTASPSFAAASSAATRPSHPPAPAAGHSLSVAPSASVTPRSSRPVTPVAPIVRAGAQATKVGEVGKVEDDDWDQSGDEA